MPKTVRKKLLSLWVGLSTLLLVFNTPCQAQETATMPLKSFLSALEVRFDIKFSYIDADVMGITVQASDTTPLDEILNDLEVAHHIEIKKLSDRYYTLVKNPLVTVCGTVLDNFAENSIPGATVEVFGGDTSIVTNTDGTFELQRIPRNASLKIRYLGYVTKYVTVESLLKSTDCTKILLAQYYEELEEVVVYEFLTPGIIKETDASITLNTTALGLLPGLIEPDVLQSVQALPGIKSIDETVSDINVRGGTNDQNLILWNGIKMYQNGHFFGLISAFNPYLTNNVSIYKNGTPSQYGDGVSSVISLQTEDGVSNTFKGGAGFNLISGDVFGRVPINDRMSFQLAARRSTTDFLDTPIYSSFEDRAFQDSEVTNQQNQTVDENLERETTFFFYDVSGKLLYDISEAHKIRLSFIGIDNDLLYRETNAGTGETTQSLIDQTNLSIGVQSQNQWSTRWSSNLNVYFSRYNLDAESLLSNQAQLLFQRNTVEERAAKFHTKYRLSEALKLSGGAQYIETGITNTSNVTQPPFNSDSKEVVRNYAPYTQLSFGATNDRFLATVGARANYLVNPSSEGAAFNEWIFEPRLNLNFRIAPFLRAELLGEFKSQYTNQVIDLEQNFLGVEKRRWTLSNNADLPITKSRQGSAGINYAKNSFYVGLEGFYKYVDGISTRTQGFLNDDQFNGELGSYTVRGLEFLVNKKGGNYSTWLSYTFNQNDYRFDDIAPSVFPNNLDVRHSITFASTYNLRDFKFGVGLNYRSGRPYTAPDDTDPLDGSVFPNRINYENANSRRLSEYFRLDASATYAFEINEGLRANAGVSLLNLTGRKNLLNRYYRLSTDNEIEQVDNFSLGFIPNISFRVNF